MKVTVSGEAVVVTSALTLKDIENVKKGNKAALTLMGGKDNKEPIFSIDVAKNGSGTISDNGIEFAPVARGTDKLATVTVVASGIEDIKAWFADKYGAALANLVALEEALPAVAEEIATQKQAILDSITVAD